MLPWLLALAVPALAQDALSFSAVRVVEHGKGHPTLTFQPAVAGGMDVSLTCGPQAYEISKPLKPGVPITMELTGLAVGTWQCSGSVHLEASDGSSGDMPLRFEVSSLQALDWSYGMNDVDLQAKTLVVHPSRPLTDATLQVYGVGGARIDAVPADLSDPNNPRFFWTSDAEAVKLVVEGTDQGGLRGRLELSPWTYTIPHDDVVFASGSSTITAAEAPKLEATWADTRGVMDKYGSVVDIELFVAGYTDTVGDAASNQALSERRARAIAQWFRNRGFSGPIWYQGFGEDALGVQTPDETDEPANRRALYVLAAETPATSELLPRADWHKL